MSRWPRLVTSLIVGLTAWGSVQHFGLNWFPNSGDVAAGVAIATGLISGALALHRQTWPLLILLVGCLILAGLGFLLMESATGDGPGMAAGMLTLISALLALGVAPAAGLHGLLRFASYLSRGREAS